LWTARTEQQHSNHTPILLKLISTTYLWNELQIVDVVLFRNTFTQCTHLGIHFVQYTSFGTQLWWKWIRMMWMKREEFNDLLSMPETRDSRCRCRCRSPQIHSVWSLSEEHYWMPGMEIEKIIHVIVCVNLCQSQSNKLVFHFAMHFNFQIGESSYKKRTYLCSHIISQ
jgi:hypothetical protein